MLLENRAGELTVAAKLAEAGVNLEAAYVIGPTRTVVHRPEPGFISGTFPENGPSQHAQSFRETREPASRRLVKSQDERRCNYYKDGSQFQSQPRTRNVLTSKSLQRNMALKSVSNRLWAKGVSSGVGFRFNTALR